MKGHFNLGHKSMCPKCLCPSMTMTYYWCCLVSVHDITVRYVKVPAIIRVLSCVQQFSHQWMNLHSLHPVSWEFCILFHSVTMSVEVWMICALSCIRVHYSCLVKLCLYRLTTHNTPLIDFRVLWPLLLVLSAFFKWKYMYKPMYFFNHQNILYHYKK